MKTNKTIIFLHPHFLKPGGASTVVLEQAYGLQKKGLHCIIVTTKINPAVTDGYPHLKIIELSGLTTGSLLFWFTFPIFYLKLQKILDTVPHKIIFCHSLSIYWGYWYKKIHPNASVTYYLHDVGLPYTDQIIEINSLPFHQRMWMNLITPLLRLFNKNIVTSANYIIANSHTSANYISDRYKRTADAVIYPGINTHVFKPSSKKLDYIYTVGRLEKLKRIDQIINAFAYYHKTNPKSKTSLLIVGEGNEKNNLAKLTRSYGMGKYVKFLSSKNSKEIAQIASQALIGIFLCPYESFGLSVLESLASGTPVIGISKNGIQEIIGKNKIGILVDGSVLSVYHAIYKLMKHPAFLATTSNNAASYAPRFDRNIQINKLYSMFTRM